VFFPFKLKNFVLEGRL